MAISQTVKTYPTLNAGFHRHDPAAGRVWYLLRAIDQDGRGWLDVDQVREGITCYTWRHLRHVLNEGNGRFWDYDPKDGKIWIYSPSKAALALDCGRLLGQPVEISTSALMGGIQQVRAAFYASYHASRKEDNPISRATLRRLTGVPESTQRIYDEIAGTLKRRNWSIEPKTKESEERAHWQGGHGTFTFIDWQGKFGPKRKEYAARRLPNSHTSNLAKSPKGRQRKINKRIDLVNSATRGNGSDVDRKYYQDGGAAGKAYNRNPHQDIYYRRGAVLSGAAERPSKLAPVALWSCLHAC